MVRKFVMESISRTDAAGSEPRIIAKKTGSNAKDNPLAAGGEHPGGGAIKN